MYDDLISDKSVDEIFDEIKDKINIRGKISQHRLWDDCLFVSIQFTIDDLHNWLENNYLQGLLQTRQLFYKFTDYVKQFVEYGYHFKNVDNINRFLPINNNELSLADGVIEEVALKENYNVCCAAEIGKFKIAEDSNSFTFDAIAECYLSDEDPDENVKSRKIVSDEKKEKKEVKSKKEIIDDLPDTIEEENQQLLDDFNQTQIFKAANAALVLKQQKDNANDIEYIKMLRIKPKVVSLQEKNDKYVLKLALSKIAFSNDFSLYKETDVNEAWDDLKQDMLLHTDKIYTYIDKSLISSFLMQNKITNFHFSDKIYNVDLSKETSIKFYIDVLK